MEALQESQPGAEFTLVGYPSTLEIARDFVRVSAIHSIEVEPWRLLFHQPLQNLEFDRAIVWMKDASVAENLRRSGLKEVLHANPFPETGHVAAHLLTTLGLNMPPLPDRWHPESQRIILHPGSGSPRKCWPYFRQFAERLPAPTLLIGPAEEHLECDRYPKLEGLSLSQVAKELAVSAAFIGNDSGITHLAAHLGVPTLAIFGPTDPEMWGPVGRRVRVTRSADLAALAVDDVLQELRNCMRMFRLAKNPTD